MAREETSFALRSMVGAGRWRSGGNPFALSSKELADFRNALIDVRVHAVQRHLQDRPTAAWSRIDARSDFDTADTGWRQLVRQSAIRSSRAASSGCGATRIRLNCLAASGSAARGDRQ